MEEDCTGVIADAQAFLACSSEVVSPVLEVVVSVGSLAVTITVIVVGIRFTQKVVRLFNPSDEIDVNYNS